jgi:hypothetical protein
MTLFENHHQIEKPIVVVHIEMRNAVAINFAYSQYDMISVPVGLPPHSIVRWNGV